MDTVVHGSNEPVRYKVVLYARVDLDYVSTLASHIQVVNVSTIFINL